ncbi:MAG: hypothetical protein P4L64_00025 [Caulobacteraceae bacterium]|nr:hypothetical protein [Caulobacteraceae bacterium]
MDEHRTLGDGEESRNTKSDFPPIYRRPPFWVEMLIGSIMAYIMGVASIITCEHAELIQVAIAALALKRF